MNAYPLPRWIAHRGGGALAPENTLAGFRVALRLGFRAVEFDVMLTADGVPVLMHDDTLERTTDGQGPLAARTWAEVAGLDAGGRFHRAWQGEGVPRLEDALAQCARLRLAANVEIKPAAGQDAATGRRVAEIVAAWPGTALLSSFSDEALAAAGERAPQVPRALLVEGVPADWRQRLQALGCIALHVRADGLDEAFLGEAAAAGVPVAAYTVNDGAAAERLFGAGVAALFTDRLDCLGPV